METLPKKLQEIIPKAPVEWNWQEKIQNHIKAGKKVAIVIGLSAGKDSTAVALLFKQKMPELLDQVHFAFADTGSELPETYEYLDKLEKYFNKPIAKLFSKAGTLKEIIEHFNGYLPSPMSRYCTRMSKIVPFRTFMDSLAATHDRVYNLVGIRADEPKRIGFVPCGEYAKKVESLMPLTEEGMILKDVFALVEAKIGLPDYYSWRTRSGCTFCFYQRRIEWVNLLEKHPKLFAEAAAMEKINPKTGKQYTWIKDMPLSELAKNAEKIKTRYKNKLKNKTQKGETLNLTDANIFEELMKELEPENADSCSICR